MSNPFIPIQPPHIDPPLFQHSPSGGEQGLAPLIQALQFNRSAGIEQQNADTQRIRAQSDAGLQKVQANALQSETDRRAKWDKDWQTSLDNAPEAIRPYLQALDKVRGLPGPLQDTAYGLLAKAIPGFKPDQDPRSLGYAADLWRTGNGAITLGGALKLAGIPTDGMTAVELGAKPIPTSTMTPEERAASRLSVQAQRDFNMADKELTQITKAQEKAQDRIAHQVVAARNVGKPVYMGPPIVYDQNDPQMKAAFDSVNHANHWDEQVPRLTQDREDARQRAHGASAGMPFSVQHADTTNILTALQGLFKTSPLPASPAQVKP